MQGHRPGLAVVNKLPPPAVVDALQPQGVVPVQRQGGAGAVDGNGVDRPGASGAPGAPGPLDGTVAGIAQDEAEQGVAVGPQGPKKRSTSLTSGPGAVSNGRIAGG